MASEVWQGYKYVYGFAEGDKEQRLLLGGKGANLAEMTRLGLPVPPGFIITTEACQRFNETGWLPKEQIEAALGRLEEQTGKRFGDPHNPLLVSVRSGAPVSMPGMLDTILNLGLNAETTKGLALQTNSEAFAQDCYQRFTQMFGNVVLGLDLARAHRVQVPDDPKEQLFMAIEAVFNSWQNPRARVYRRLHGISEELGTAVTVQAMVFGNRGADSGSGVAFTRDPNTGEAYLYGEYLPNAQGEDVVAGLKTPLPIRHMDPDLYAQLQRLGQQLEVHYREMQDIEFTVEKGRLYVLQCRAGKRTPKAAVKIAVDMANEGLISKAEALLRVQPEQIEKLLHKSIDPNQQRHRLATGLPASPGAAVGHACFDADRAEAWAQAGKPVLLIRPETTPDDIHGMVVAEGILTTRGGMTCHAAIVARGMGIPCVVGCEALEVDLERRCLTANGQLIQEGELVSIDGSTGEVLQGRVELIEPEFTEEFHELLRWADEARRLKIRANADTPQDAERARRLGAEGIGLVRTEHMFGQGGHQPERLALARRLILAETADERQAALAELEPLLATDFAEIFAAMAPEPVTVRLLDPPLHEFLPPLEQLALELALAKERGDYLPEKEALLRKVRALSEVNPMLGFRGCRVGLLIPEIYEMQVRAILAAAKETEAEAEIMLPLIGHVNELAALRARIDQIASDLGVTRYQVGTMIEVPRAALTAEQLAGVADFFSFGTNDLTQTTFGYSRDDAEGKFLASYVEQQLLPHNPFISIDVEGVGQLLKLATEAARARRPDLQVGVCGEHGGDPASIHFFHHLGLDYVSCSPYRLPVARLAAAQAALAEGAV